jgi:addiction module HigA family antidote
MAKSVEVLAHDSSYVAVPGDAIRDALESCGMTQKDLANRLGKTPKHVNEIIQGKGPITADTAIQLERVLGIPASFWTNLERKYREMEARSSERAQLAEHIGLLERFPLNDMKKFGLIPDCSDKVDSLIAILSFFGIGNPAQIDSVLTQDALAFRKPKAYQGKLENLAVWLRMGLINASKEQANEYNEIKFKVALKQVRELTREANPEVFIPKLKSLCADAGVIVLFVRELPNTGVHGVTRWLNDTTAIIQLSARYRSDDHLWFTFFHEAGHIILHGRKEVFLEVSGDINEKEDEANAFSSDFLIPPEELSSFIYHTEITDLTVRQFAQKLGIAAGIVVGRLQHDRRIEFKHLNHLKHRYKWAE